MGFFLFPTAAWLALGALLLAAAWSLRRAQPVKGARVVFRLPLEPRRSLVVVELAGRHLVLGLSDGAVSLLTEIDAGAAAQLVSAPAPLEFGTLLSRWRRA